jgi:hypothetical protein
VLLMSVWFQSPLLHQLVWYYLSNIFLASREYAKFFKNMHDVRTTLDDTLDVLKVVSLRLLLVPNLNDVWNGWMFSKQGIIGFLQ